VTQRRSAGEADSRHPRDGGFSLLEVIVSVLLMAVGGAAALLALGSAINGSGRLQQHANAITWLQTASDVIVDRDTPRIPCVTADDSAHIAGYTAVAQAVPNPDGWPASQITVTNVRFWDGTTFRDDICYETLALKLQLIELTATSPDGRVTEHLQVVKGGCNPTKSDC
jgi:prepilin-type N-terminal cleavage/methylation domain-containing protein